jgi:hypothetical protein
MESFAASSDNERGMRNRPLWLSAVLILAPLFLFQNCGKGFSGQEIEQLNSVQGTNPAPAPTTNPNPASQPAPAPVPMPVPTPTPAPTTFQLGQVPFAANSSWNTPIKTGATYTKLNWPKSTGYNYGVNWDAYSPSIYIASSADAVVAVKIPNNWGWPAQTLNIRMPPEAKGAVGTDEELLIIDGTTVHNFWGFVRNGNTATADAYGRADLLKDSGWGSKSPFLSAGIVAAGSSQFAGMIVQAETDAGEINHALHMAIDFALNLPGAVGMAISSDGGSKTGISHEGDRLAIPPGTPMPAGLSPLGQKVFNAYVKYGVYNVDQAGGCSILRAQANAYDNKTITALGKDLGKITPLLQLVTNY